MTIFDTIHEKLDAGAQIFEKDLSAITQAEEAFMTVLTEMFDVLLQMIKIVIDLFVSLSSLFYLLPLIIPSLAIMFVIGKINQIL